MTTYKYEDGDKELFANEMDEVENVSYRDTMIKFHASSTAPVLKAYLDKDKKCRLPYNDDIVYRAASIIAEKTYENFTKCSFDSCFESLFKKELSKKEQICLLKGAQLTETQLFSLFNFAEECGYRFSHYKWQGDPKSVNYLH